MALVASGGIVYLVFNFGYYASGLAAFKYEQQTRRETPIRTEFADPDIADPNGADPNSP